MVAMLDADLSGKLGFEEFKTLWLSIREWKVSKKNGIDSIRSCRNYINFVKKA